MPPTCCPHASEQPNLWLCFLMILNGQSSNTHPRGHSYQKSILLQPSCCTDHTLQGFSRLCLQISPAAPDCHLESHCAKGDTYICPSLSPFHFLCFQFGISHCSELSKSICKGLKDMAKLKLDVSLHGVNVGSYGTSLW